MSTDPTGRMVCALGFVLLVSMARSPPYLFLAGALFLALLAFQPARRIATVLRTAVPAMCLTAVILLPYSLAAGPARPLLLLCKVFLSAGAVALVASTTEWVTLSGAARRLRVPALVVLVLDVAVRFIALLGELALEMLQAVRLRSVGRNPCKEAALGGVAGTLFLRSQVLADDLHAAMVCRCFTGEYRPAGRLSLGWLDAVLGVGLAGLVVAFIVWPGVP